ncbi:hypothetical protein H1164_03825 [Thermoactinomyces daqus]|uniref:DUF2637 domain-containing protein n=1 Tax=Thermoactinomyces daqus TaxID=1329516 RepID=A0A7W1X8I1_9BACL|nr:hypothetical protein [Thermoactinomyces daqus]MBA4542030.1 hypothetical protein [Thermoactinomyces daqus]
MKMFKSPSVFDIARAVGYLLLIGNMLISYYHALELERALVALPDPLPHVWVVSLDLVFILSVIVLSQSGGRGFLPWLLFLFGLAFTGWSNIRVSFLAGDREGIIVNGSTVVALLLLELLLRWMEKNREMFGHSDKKSDTSSDSRTDDKAAGQHRGQSNTAGQINGQSIGHLGHSDSSDSKPDILSDNQADETDSLVITGSATDTSDMSDTAAKMRADTEPVTRTAKESDGQSHKAADTKTDTSDSGENRTKKSDTRTERKTDKRTDTQTKSDNKTDNVSEHPIAVAKRLIEELGDYPSIRKLAAEAGISKHKADKILKELKAQAS